MSELLKRAAVEKAAAMVEDGMDVGLGTGSTALAALGDRIKEEGLQCVGIPISRTTEIQAIAFEIKISDLKVHSKVDIVIDGTDAVDLRSFTVIKGMGGALLREKIVASASRRLAVIVDPTKLAYPLGVGTSLPVEIVEFGWPSTKRRLDSRGCTAILRMAENKPKRTDGGNLTLDCYFGPIADPADRAAEIKSLGLIECGLFVGMATEVIVGEAAGVRIFSRPTASPFTLQLLGK